MSRSNIKYIYKESNKSVKQTMKITIFLQVIVTYRTTIDHTYLLLYNTSKFQMVTSNIKVDKERKGLNKL